jgi:hypothetical protein
MGKKLSALGCQLSVLIEVSDYQVWGFAGLHQWKST